MFCALSHSVYVSLQLSVYLNKPFAISDKRDNNVHTKRDYALSTSHPFSLSLSLCAWALILLFALPANLVAAINVHAALASGVRLLVIERCCPVVFTFQVLHNTHTHLHPHCRRLQRRHRQQQQQQPRARVTPIKRPALALVLSLALFLPHCQRFALGLLACVGQQTVFVVLEFVLLRK